jgi:EAL domain-containing protein (putative c-di-GMP-specific phosphodiesterase class I)
MGESPSIAELRFLIVEDHGFQRWALANVLKELGARYVFPVGDGHAALELLAEVEVDIAISDLEMPGMDGMEFIRHLGEAARDISLIVASGLDRPLVRSVEMMARAYGVRLLGSLDKPVTTAKLRPLIDKHMSALPAPRAGSPGVRHFAVGEILAALQRGEIEPFFQPKVDLRSRSVRGAEALARWRHPTEGVVGAPAFIPVLEKAGDTAELTASMAAQSAATCRTWRTLGFDVNLALNLSQQSLADVGLAERITGIVLAAGLLPRDVILEVTESAMAVDLGRALENLSRLRMKGFGLSIDDYGTGYSSLQQLSRIAFTELKIDQAFVRTAAGPGADRAMLESSLEMAGKLGIPAVAEGVESEAEWDVLRAMGCDLAQGFYIARPMESAGFLDWLKLRRVGAAPA